MKQHWQRPLNLPAQPHAALWALIALTAVVADVAGEFPAPQVALFEDHNEALSHWLALREEDKLTWEPHTLLHIDSHADFGAPDGDVSDLALSPSDLPSPNEAYALTSIKDFLTMAAWLGLTDDIVYVAPPWDMQIRELQETSVEMIVGADKEGRLKFALRPPHKDTFKDILEDQIVPWKERKRLRRPTLLRFRWIPAENALDFFKSGKLFDGRSHQRLLLDLDLDVFSSSSPRGLQAQSNLGGPRETQRLHRNATGLGQDLITGFFDDSGTGIRRTMSEEELRKTKTRQETFVKALELVAADPSVSLEEWHARLENFFANPYQVSTERELETLFRYWARAFDALPVSPTVVTLARSPFYTPDDVIRRIECEMLALLHERWPATEPIRVRKDLELWHTECTSKAVSSWSSTSVLSFDVDTSTPSKVWSNISGYVEVFGPAFEELHGDDVPFLLEMTANASEGEVHVFWRSSEADEEWEHLMTLVPGETEEVETYSTHVLVARCATGNHNAQEVHSPRLGIPWDIQLNCPGEASDEL
eukprot:TRINITY_DN24517_c0_g1_i1.p1 TRINITY_DN24517_c0_g1~~TRINITY_DN24517_c0_g1_i1.p1  ORF type:complete len:536 (+),score=97.31 TRINITY_DN24517_c0_g1_i1:84-1691(+)